MKSNSLIVWNLALAFGVVASVQCPLAAYAQAQTQAPAAASSANAVVTSGSASVAPTPIPLPEPKITDQPDNTRYINRPSLMVSCTNALAAFTDKPCDVIFIGDSITAGWGGAGRELWKQLYVPRKALNFGIGGDKTQNVLWRLGNMDVKQLRPKVAVLLIGTNNTANTPAEITTGVRAVIAKTESVFPKVKVILISIFPNRRANDKMMEANKTIQALADEKNVFYLDLAKEMTPVHTTGPDGKVDDNWKGLSKDHLHLDAGGYKLWADTMEPLLKKLLTAAQ